MEGQAATALAKMVTPAPVALTDPSGALDKDAVTIGRVLEAIFVMAGDRMVDQSDATTIQVAETCATGSHTTIPGGVATATQSVADQNTRALRDEDKVKL
ncbi:unnamed protein product [Miscanthus lutarioriparius]|uniref:SMP domain-containing protein n=1 Tax=Miscanthus lutarioriparius TaxID=422564 RepID=A0A811ND75_9POAL|nr:unnamed protein product [Miscanthus lutarioriparius]